MKYLVMECFNSYAVLLDEEGRFVKSANLGYEIGETIENPVLMLDEPMDKPQRRVSNKVVAAIVAIAAVIAIFFGIDYYQENLVPYSSIFMAINPEVEMVLSKNGDVIDIQGTNADGATLIEEYTPVSKNRIEVANELVDRAIDMGFLAEGGRVSIAIDTPDKALFEKYGIEFRRELDGRISITIEITDMENKNKTPKPPVEKEPVPADDTDYDDTNYDDSSYEETPAPAPAPTPAPPAPSDDTDYDDTDYDDTDYDDSDYGSSTPPIQPVQPANSNDDDSDYDDSDYDDSDYDDSDYD